MEVILKEQKVTAEKIKQLYTNYKKDGDVRKTKKYIEAKITTLKLLYKVFVDADDSIRNHTPLLEASHEYFQERKATTDLYNVFIEEMRKRLNTAPTTPTSLDSLQAPIFNYPPTSRSEEPIENSVIKQLIKQQNIKMRCMYKEINAAEKLMDTDNRSKHAATLKLKNIERMMWQIMELNEKICMEATEEDEDNNMYFTEAHYENVNEQYNSIVIAMTEDLESTNNIEPMEIRLKAIEIPQFNGDYLKWAGFSDIFKRLVHDNNKLTSTHKMNYLKTHVLGQAGQLLNHMEPSDENYAAAWEILQHRYSNQRLIVSHLLDKLINQPIINTESAVAIRTLHDTSTECLFAIRNSGINIESWSPFIIFTLCRKLDNESRRIYEGTLDNPKEFQSTTQFLKFLERRFQSLEAIGNNKMPYKPQQPAKFIPIK